MEFAGVSVKPSEIIETIRKVSSYLNRDKNALCLGLILINENIAQWYREMAFFIDDEVAKNLLKPGEKNDT